MKHLFTFSVVLTVLSSCLAQPASTPMRNSLSASLGAGGLAMHRLPFDPGKALFSMDVAAGYHPPGLLAQALLGFRSGRNDLIETHLCLLAHKTFGSGREPYIGGGIGLHHFSMKPSWWTLADAEDNGISLVGSAGLVLLRGSQFNLTGDVKGYAVMARKFGKPMLMGSAGIGISSQPGGMDIPMPCMLGAVGAFIATGIFLALNP